MDEYYRVIRFLPDSIFANLQKLPLQTASRVHEIRLRSNRPIVLCAGTESFAFPDRNHTLSQKALQECYYTLCDFSVHAHEEALAKGYFTLCGGHRVGVAGYPIYQNNKIASYRTIYSLNLRIARSREVQIPKELYAFLRQGNQGMLLVGPPGSGKTTLLRSIAAILSSFGRKICVIDSRSEIFPGTSEGYLQPPPLNCDVLEGYEKADGIMIALRTMGPQYILCDEIGTQADTNAVLLGLCAGVCFFATIHGNSYESVCHRPQFCRLADSMAFGAVAVLQGADHPGAVAEVKFL